MITFRVPAVPVAQPRQRHRALSLPGGRVVTQNFTPAKHPVQAFKATVRLAAQQAYAGPPLEGPILLRLVFILPRPGRLRWKSRPMPRVRHTAKPDIDNLAKSVKDALSGRVWRDDSQVCGLVASKWYAAGDEAPGVEVEIQPI